jgi:hypothetical protein
MARENSGWGYDRIAGALTNLKVSAQIVGNVLKRHGLAPAPKRSQNTTWREFMAAHMAVLVGADFFGGGIGPGEAWPPIACSSSCIWKAGT